MSHLEDPNVEGFKILQNLIPTFWNSRNCEFVNGNNSADGEPYVWPVSIAVQSIIDASRINRNFIPTLQQTMEVFGRYYNSSRHAYSAGMGGDDDIYFDDNAQVATCFLTAYEVTQDRKYLDRGVELVNFLMTGALDGGVRWHVSKEGANSCTTAEVGKACAQLARFVANKQPYLDFAHYCFKFIFDKMRDPDDGLVCDGFGNDNGLDKQKWTYNQGTPLSLCGLLYGHTQNDEYYQRAKELATTVTDTNTWIFARDTNNHDQRYYRDNLNFYQLLCEGFADYLLFFGDKDKELSERVTKTVYRHLVLIYKFDQHPGGHSWYAGTLQVYNLDNERCKAYNEMTGENRQCQPAASEHENGDVNKPFAPSMMSTGSAARCFFQSARVVPRVDI